MPKYTIDAAGVKTVLENTQKEAGKFSEIMGPMSDVAALPGAHAGRTGIVSSAAAACGFSGAVVPALSEFFEVQATNLTAMGNRINACITGAAAATSAYVNGDEEMVATYQKNASQLTLSEYPPK